MIYYARDVDEGSIKIGSSKDPEKRVRELAYVMRRRLKIMGVHDGGLKEEKRLHRRFAGHRIVGEWFTPAADLLAHIEAGAVPLVLVATGVAREEQRDYIFGDPAYHAGPGGRPPSGRELPPIAVQVRGTAEWEAYLVRLSNALGTDKSGLVERAIRTLAAAHGHEPPPPRTGGPAS